MVERGGGGGGVPMANRYWQNSFLSQTITNTHIKGSGIRQSHQNQPCQVAVDMAEIRKIRL